MWRRPVSPEAAQAFNERIDALVRNCRAYNSDLRAAATCTGRHRPSLWLHRRARSRHRSARPHDPAIVADSSIPVVAVCASCTSASLRHTDATHPKLPPRPREIRINGFDPCSALSPPQLEVASSQYFDNRQAAGETRGPGCEWIHSPYRAGRDLHRRHQHRWRRRVTFGQPQLNVITVAGFGAVETPGLYSSGQRRLHRRSRRGTRPGRAGRILLQRLDRADESRDRVPEGAQRRGAGDADDPGQDRGLSSARST